MMTDAQRRAKATYRKKHRAEILEKQAKYRQDNHDTILTKSRQYYADNRDAILARIDPEANRARVAAWRAKDPERTKQLRNASYQRHREEIAAKAKLIREADPEKARQKKAASYQKHRETDLPKARARQAAKFANETPEDREKRLDYSRKRREANPHEWMKWYKKNYDRQYPLKRAHESRRRARKQDLPATWTGEQKAFMLHYWNDSCAACGNPKGFFWTLADDHWIPLTSPDCPGTVAANMIPLCHGQGGCNNSKNASPPHAWLLQRFGAKKTAKIEKAITQYFKRVTEAFPLV